MKRIFKLFIFFGLILLVFSLAKTNIAEAYTICSEDTPPVCVTLGTPCGSCTTPNPGPCARAISCPACFPASGCCGSAGAWSKWTPHCVWSGLTQCRWEWEFDTRICSTADKCILGETGLRAGYCNCSYGGTYKYCCTSSGIPEGCIAVPALSDGIYPPEGQCPGGYLIDGVRVKSSPCSGVIPTAAPGQTPIPTQQPVGGCDTVCSGSERSWCTNDQAACLSLPGGTYNSGSSAACCLNAGEHVCCSANPTMCAEGYWGYWNDFHAESRVNVKTDATTYEVGDTITVTIGQWNRTGGQCSCRYGTMAAKLFHPGGEIFVPGYVVCTASGFACNPTETCTFSTASIPDGAVQPWQSSWVGKPYPAGVYQLIIDYGGHDGACSDSIATCYSNSFTLTAPKTCSVEINGVPGADTNVVEGTGFDVSLKATGNSSVGETARLAIERQDGGLINPIDETLSDQISLLGNYSGNNYYKIGDCDSVNRAQCEYNYPAFGSTLPPGNYYLHCDIANNNPPKKCTGNPLCASPIGITTGGTDCSTWNSCSTTDYAKLCVQGAPAAPTIVNPTIGDKIFDPLPNPEVTFRWTQNWGTSCSGTNTFEVNLTKEGGSTTTIATNLPEGATSFGYNGLSASGYGIYTWQVIAVNGAQRTPSTGWFIYAETPTSWFQTKDGDVYAEELLNIEDPPYCAVPRYFSANGDSEDGVGSGTPGVISYGSGIGGIGEEYISSTKWKANTKDNSASITYDYLKNRLNLDETISLPNCPDSATECSIPVADGTYYLNKADVNIPLRAMNGEKIIIFASGNVNIIGDITVDKPGFFALIVKGNITFSKDVANAQGFYLADGVITVAKDGVNPDNAFNGQGSFVGWGGINMGRELPDNCLPAELFEPRPDFYINAPDSFKFTRFVFQELAP